MNNDSIFDLYRHDGATVLIRTAQDHHNPETAVRGTVDVRPTSETDPTPAVKLVIDFPELFSREAHRRVIHLDHRGIERLLSTEHDGAFDFTVDEALDPAA